MLDQSEIADQLQQLKVHRQTLAFLLQQQAILGKSFTPPSVLHGILEARGQIFRIKSVLKQQGVDVEDLPDDEDNTFSTSILIPKRKRIYWLVFLAFLISILVIIVPRATTPACFFEETYISDQKATL